MAMLRTTAMLAVLCYSWCHVQGEATGNDLIRYSIEDSSHTFVTDITDKLEERGLSIKQLFAVSNAEALENRCLLPGVKQWVNKKIKDDYAMNIKVAFTLLGKVGELLRVSYAGCKGYDCSIKVGLVHSRYQTMIYDSARVAQNFVNNALRALKYHYYAKRKADKEELPKAIKWIQRCGKLADKMKVQSEEMVQMSDQLKNLTENAYISTLTDDVKNKKEIDEFKLKMGNITASIESLRANLKEQTKSEREAREAVRKAVNEAEKWENEHMTEAGKKIKVNEICSVTSVPSFSLGPLSFSKTVKSCHTEVDQGAVQQQKILLDKYEKQIVIARNRQLEVLKIKRKIQETNAHLYGELAGSLKGHKLAAATTTELKRAKMSLQIAIKTLTLVKTIFLNALQFWIKVTDSANSLGSKGDTNLVLEELGVEDSEEFTELLVESGFSWLALGKVCNDAAVSMRAVKAEVTKVFIDLPNYKQAKLLIDTCGPIIKETSDLINAMSEHKQKDQKEIDEAEEAVKAEKKLGMEEVVDNEDVV